MLVKMKMSNQNLYVMLSGITWTQYFTTIGIGLVIYYLYVAVWYYPEEIKKLLSGQRIRQGAVADDERQLFRKEHAGHDDDDDGYDPLDEDHSESSEFEDVEALVGNLTHAVEQASKKKLVVGEFKQSLKMAMRERPAVKTSPFRSSINELIVSECGKYGVFTLSEKEIDVLWDEVV